MITIAIERNNENPQQICEGDRWFVDNFYITFTGARSGTGTAFETIQEARTYADGLRRGFWSCGFEVEITEH